MEPGMDGFWQTVWLIGLLVFLAVLARFTWPGRSDL